MLTNIVSSATSTQREMKFTTTKIYDTIISNREDITNNLRNIAMNSETRNITLNIPEECIQEFLLSVPQVEKIIIKRHGNLFDITAVIDKDDREARYKLYDLEARLIENLENYLFDFHTIIRQGRKLEDIITVEPANIYPKEK